AALFEPVGEDQSARSVVDIVKDHTQEIFFGGHDAARSDEQSAVISSALTRAASPHRWPNGEALRRWGQGAAEPGVPKWPNVSRSSLFAYLTNSSTVASTS